MRMHWQKFHLQDVAALTELMNLKTTEVKLKRDSLTRDLNPKYLRSQKAVANVYQRHSCQDKP